MENSNIRNVDNTKDDTIDSISNEGIDTENKSQTDMITAGTADNMSNCGAKFSEQQAQGKQKMKQQQIDEKNEVKDQPKTEGSENATASVNPCKVANDNGKNIQEESLPLPKKNRCDKCGKKIGLTGQGYPCRCGGTYCAFHRYSDRHDCNFDYREMGANQIRRDNPLVVPDKVRKL